MNFELNFQFSIFSFQLSFGRSLRAGLSAISLLASFLLAQKYLQIPKSPFPAPESPTSLAKDAAAIPNALGEL